MILGEIQSHKNLQKFKSFENYNSFKGTFDHNSLSSLRMILLSITFYNLINRMDFINILILEVCIYRYHYYKFWTVFLKENFLSTKKNVLQLLTFKICILHLYSHGRCWQVQLFHHLALQIQSHQEAKLLPESCKFALFGIHRTQDMLDFCQTL